MKTQFQSKSTFSVLKQKIKENRKRTTIEKCERSQITRTQTSIHQNDLSEINDSSSVLYQKTKQIPQDNQKQVMKVKTKINNVKFQGQRQQRRLCNKNQNTKLQNNKIIRLNLNQLVLKQGKNIQIRKKRLSADLSEVPNETKTRSRSKSHEQMESKSNLNIKKRSLSTYHLIKSPSPQPMIQSHHRSQSNNIFLQDDHTPTFQKKRSIKTYPIRSSNPITHPPPQKESFKKIFKNKNETSSCIYTEYHKSNPNLFICPQKQVMVLRQSNKTRVDNNRNDSRMRRKHNLSVTNIGDQNIRALEKKHFGDNNKDKVGYMIRQF